MYSMTVRTASATYPVVVGARVLEEIPQRLAAEGLQGAVWLIADAALTTAAADVERHVRAGGYRISTLLVPSGEASKSAQQLQELYDWLIGGGVERRDIVLALGGGVIGDLAGYAAATTLRGLTIVQLPSTLLAMVDAAIGGKTAINHRLGKNLIGAFHQPRVVLADTTLLATLPARELRAGWAEVIKHGVIRDGGLFSALNELADARHWQAGGPTAAWDAADPQLTEQLTALIARAAAVKTEVVSLDEFEQGERITLNYGHTIGHAIEQAAGYQLLHGECVAIGMDAAARIAEQLGLCSADLVRRQRDLLGAYGLSVQLPPELISGGLAELIQRDKKVLQGRIRWVLPTAIGSVTVRSDVPHDVVQQVLATLELGSAQE
jgi:3-dehydroquinate synthase